MAQRHGNLISVAPVSASTFLDSQCAGITKSGSRCKRSVEGKAYCHSHNMQLPKPIPISAVPMAEPTSPIPETDLTSSAAESDSPLTMNTITSRIPNLLPSGYYQCSGISQKGSRCKWHVKDKSYCHFHDTQLLDAITHRHSEKDIVVRMITQVRSRRHDDDAIRHSILHSRGWADMHVDNLENLLRNISRGPLEPKERNQGPHAVVPRLDHSYLCRGHTRVGRSCRIRTVGGFYCRLHDLVGISGCDVAMAFAMI